MIYMQNTLGDLNNHLFAQLERLGDENLKGEDLEKEIIRTKAVTSVATQIILNGTLVLAAKRLIDNREDDDTIIPKMLEG